MKKAAKSPPTPCPDVARPARQPNRRLASQAYVLTVISTVEGYEISRLRFDPPPAEARSPDAERQAG